jgi:pimeloyl-ACP methyl ester carboxylesterase
MNQHLVPGAAGTDVFVLEHGSGTPVLLLAGLGDKHDAWGFQFETLGSERRLLALDNRGTGRSALPDEGVTMPGMADDAAAVLQALDATPAHVMGFSGGGAVAQELVLRHPDLARSLVPRRHLVTTRSAPQGADRDLVRAAGPRP